MIDSLALTITVACVVLALAALAPTLAGRFRADRFACGLLAVELALVLQLVLAVVALLRGRGPAEPATVVAYLACSVVILPVAATQLRGASGRWPGAVLVAVLVFQAVVVVRTQTTWRA